MSASGGAKFVEYIARVGIAQILNKESIWRNKYKKRLKKYRSANAQTDPIV